MTRSDDSPNVEFSELTRFVTFRLSKVQNALTRQAITTLAALTDISLTEYRMLAAIEDAGTTTATEIVAETQIDKAQVSRAINALRKRGYLAVTENARDQRQHRLSLTPDGQSEHDRLRTVMRRRHSFLTQHIDAGELATLFSILERLEIQAQKPVPPS